MDISSVIDHMFKRYISKNCYSIIYLKTDILTIINRHGIINFAVRIYLTGKGCVENLRREKEKKRKGEREREHNNFY